MKKAIIIIIVLCIFLSIIIASNAISNLNSIDNRLESVSETQIQVIDAFFRDRSTFYILDTKNKDITEQFYLDNKSSYEEGNYKEIQNYILDHVKSINFQPDVIFKNQQKD